jgi:hypothetical protein
MRSTARIHSRNILNDCRIELGADYHALSTDQVQALIDWANRDKYRKPVNANGSRGRYYHAMLQRRAAS